ncbi:MAG: hypothetical protein SVZ03_03320 [Spirochaetota bacterium]|nr:hypothetical protein [Spirochaetota bacterium]
MHRLKRSFVITASLILIMSLMIGCGGCGDDGDDSGPPPWNNSGVQLQFDIAGAMAVAGSTSSSSKATRGSESQSSDIVKIMEDGTVEGIISFVSESQDQSDIWRPNVAFISIGSDGSLYLCFEWPYQEWDFDAHRAVQFVRIYSDNTYDIIWPLNPESYSESIDGRVETWSWWGMDSDPLVKDSEGKLYFKVSKGSGSNMNESVWCYDPVLAEAPVQKTPENATLSIQNFKVDSQGHLFIKSAEWNQNENYLRFYTPGKTAVNNIYYSSSSTDMWVRGYVTHPNGNAVIINGYNILGMSGILRANISDDDVVTYDILYANGNQGGGSWIHLIKWNNDNWTSGTELIVQYDDDYSSTYGQYYPVYDWIPDILTSDVVDEQKAINRVRGYFYGDVSFNDFNAFKNNLTKTVSGDIWNYDTDDWESGSFSEFFSIYNSEDWGDMKNSRYAPSDNPKQYWDNWGVAHKIEQDAETFLIETFDGSLMKTWLAENDMSSLDFNNVGAMLWASDGSLYGLYSQCWWGGGGDNNTKVLKLLDENGDISLAVVELNHGNEVPTKIKIVGDYLYYRYAVMDANGWETGTHELARINLLSEAQEDLTNIEGLDNMEILSYDIDDDNTTMYFSGLDYASNKVIFGKINISEGTFTEIEAEATFNTIRVF